MASQSLFQKKKLPLMRLLEWFWDWLDRLDGNVDGAVFGLGKAVKKLDKAIAANQRQAAKSVDKVIVLQAKADLAGIKASKHNDQVDRAKRVKAKVEELLT